MCGLIGFSGKENFNTEKTEETPVIAKWENTKEIFRIITSYPRFEIKTSKDHLFFVRTEIPFFDFARKIERYI